MVSLNLDPSGQFLTLSTPARSMRFHAIWLRDNSHDPETRSSGNGQRLISLRDVPKDTHIASADLQGEKMKILFEPENKSVTFELDWLISNAYDNAEVRHRGWIGEGVETWDTSLMENVPTGDYSELVCGGPALRDWLEKIIRYGFGKIENGPVEDGSLFQIVDLFGYVRETNYGRHFEVRTEVNPTNLAYTGLGLQAHTDNPYRDPVPTIQVLYCLESSAPGGENMVVDGFAAINRLRNENQEYFDVLADYCASFEYAGEAGVCLTSRKPIIELAPEGELTGIRFNNRSMAAVTDVPFDKMSTYYEAYRRLGEIIDDEAMEVTFRLNPGEAFLVDNRRVLHARKGYSGEGTRCLQGCYADMDGLRSTYDAMQRQASG